MIDGRAATGLDRLPWLEDETDRPARTRMPAALPWLILLIIAVAALSYWIGARGWEALAPAPSDGSPAPRSTLTLPEPRPPQPAPAPSPNAMDAPGVAPVVEPPPVVVRETSREVAPPRARIVVKNPEAPAETAKASESASDEDVSEKADRAEKAPPPVRKLADWTPWPVRVIEGSSGRLVRVGTFRTRHQAKVGWKKLMRVNPSLQRLPALVVPVTSARNGRTYYRLQMGTTSQAHSAALCQKLRMIGLSCVVVPATAAPANAASDQ